MMRCSSSFQRRIIIITLFYFKFFFRSYWARNYFDHLDLSSQTLNPIVTGFMLTGNAASDQFGNSVSTAGDINKDGYDDFIIGASAKNGNQGAAYVIYGGPESAFLNIDLSITSLNPLTTGFTITGSAASDFLGFSVSSAGDINNDEYDDIIIGAPWKDSYKGAAYVIYGGSKSSMSNWDFSSGATLDPLTTGFMITGYAASVLFGCSVSTAGDIDGDGYDDLIIGAWANNQGTAYVIYGGANSAMADIPLSSTTLYPHTTGFMITGKTAGDQLGIAVSTAGDINNDGYADIIVGAQGKDSNRGAAYVIYGRDKSTMSNWDFSSGTTLDPLTTGFMITGNTAGDYFGYSVSTTGDINNDGYADIIVGTPYKNSYKGVAYIIYGGEKSSMPNLDFSSGSTLTPSTTGFMMTGSAAGDQLGASVSKAGDVNNDGYNDIIVGAFNKNAAYVIYGGEKSSMSNWDFSSTTLDPTSTGFTIMGNAASDRFGAAVSTAGDINGDGYYDIIVGANGKSNSQGAAYVIFASCSPNCKQCFNPSLCSECKNPYLMYQYECFTSCPDTTLATSATICEDCPTRCLHCSSTSTCTECISPFVLYDSQCLTSCPITMFNSNNVCKSCPSYCYSCTSQDSCQVCFEGYILSNSLCVLPSKTSPQQKSLKATSSVTQGIGSVVCVGSSVFPLSSLVSKIVQNTRYLNLSVTSDLAAVYETWNTDLISWDPPNVMSDLDHFETSPSLFAQYSLGSPFLVNFWPTLLNIAIGFAIFIICIILQKFFEQVKYEGWVNSLVRKLVAGSFNFALVQVYACLDDILFYLVLDAKTNPFNSFYSWASMLCAALFLAVGCLQVFFNFLTVKKYQGIKLQGMKDIEAFNENNKYWELYYSDFNDDDLWSQVFFAIVIVRSSLSSFIITVLYDNPLMQTSYFITIDITIISFLHLKDPFNTLRGTLAQYYYEIITLLVHICAFIMALQDTFKTPSDTVRLIMSSGILYLNTALVSGAIGFMFIEIYKIISEKKRAARPKKRQSVSETQNFTETADQLQSSEIAMKKRQEWIDTVSIENSHLESENNQNLTMESNFRHENSILSETSPSHKIRLQKNQSPVPIMAQNLSQALNRRQRRKNRIPKDIISYP